MGTLKTDAGRGLAAYRRIVNSPKETGKAAGREDGGAGLFKTGLLNALGPGGPAGFQKAGAEPAEQGDSKYRRVAKFLILIGREEAAKILANLEPGQVEAVSREIASIRGITEEEGAEIVEEFRSLFTYSYGYGKDGGAAGGVDAARKILYAAFGPEKGEGFLQKSLPKAREAVFDFLEDFSGDQIALLLREESPATMALALSRLSPALTAAVLAHVSPGKRLELIKRIAHLRQTTPEMLNLVAEGLREKARRFSEAGGVDASAPLDGRGILAAILKHTDIAFEDRLLRDLEEARPDLSQELKERLYTLEDVVKADDRAVQEKLREMADRDIAMLLKGRSPEFNEKILANITANRRVQVREEREILGAVLKSETEGVVQEFLAWFRAGRENGSILLLDDEDVVS
ncbi:MAG: flagellar motor switch protein FliG [Treponema sp.]|jgi:flagellar motor switch protein FliG|nr:flagellar motor switch protein FliG [Treponema sp.]